VLALQFVEDFGVGKNEAKGGGVERQIVVMMVQFGVGSFTEELLAFGFATVLESLEFGEGFGKSALKTGFVELDVAKRALVLVPAVCLDHSFAFGGVFDGGEAGGEFFIMDESEDVGFRFAGALEAPLGVAKGLGEHRLYRAFGLQVLDKGGAELVVGGVVFRGQDDELAGEAVLGGVTGGGALAFFGAGSGVEC